MSSTNNYTTLYKLHLYQERDSKSDNIAGEGYLNAVLLLKSCNDLMRTTCLNPVINWSKHTLQWVICTPSPWPITVVR